MKVILSCHLPHIIDILIPIALPFRDTVEIVGDIETVRKNIEKRNRLVPGFYLNLSKPHIFPEYYRKPFFTGNEFPKVACKKIGHKGLSDLLYLNNRRNLDISTADSFNITKCLPGGKYYIGEYRLKNINLFSPAVEKFEGRSVTDKIVIEVITRTIDKHGVDKFFVE